MQKLSPEERLKLLTELLNEEEKERNLIAQSLHHKTGGFSAMKIWLKLLEQKSDDQNSTLKELKQALDTSIDELKAITTEIYPRMVSRLGLISALKDYCEQNTKKYGVEIKCFTQITERLKMEVIQETVVYKICADSVEYLRMALYSKINIRLTLKNESLEVEISGKGAAKKTVESQGQKQFKKLRLMKAKLIWLEAIVLTKTNWKNRMAFGFNLLEGNN
jgi:two-component system NarL family sensor kinase